MFIYDFGLMPVLGMESAATLVSKAASVTVVGKSKTPFAQVLGEQVGCALLKVWLCFK